MKRRKILVVNAAVLVVAAAFSATSPVIAADTSVQFYGHLDLSVDGATKGIKESTAVGKVGWQADISSNLSYFGFRGDHDIGGGYKMVLQVETQVDVAATPGPSPQNQASPGNADTKVLAALGSRNSFLGFAGSFGALKLGKTDAPYKLSTARMDPFSATVGDYNSIMGNTGGDNRAEFDTRLSHAIWYESNKMGGFSWSALFAPGQNRSSDTSYNADFNERQRNGSWLALTQKITRQDDLNVGWAHAAKTPGQPGGGAPGQVIANPGSVDNASNMYTLGYKHHFDRQSNWYAVYARQANKAGGHYDLGASGHGITTDCKDASGVPGVSGSNCFTGETLQAVSVGWMYTF